MERHCSTFTVLGETREVHDLNGRREKPLAGRWISTPPALYAYGPADYVRETRARTQQLLEFGPGQEQALYQLIDRDQISASKGKGHAQAVIDDLIK